MLTPFKHLCLPVVLGWTLCLLSLSAAEDTILYTVSDGVEINLWIPAGVKTLRGAIMDPANASVGRDPKNTSVSAWEETFRNVDCGHVGMLLQNMNRGNRPTILHKALLAALKEFAEKSGHSEIETMPLCFAGMSRGGGWAVSTAFKMPERTVAYGNVVCWVADSKAPDEALQIPGLFIIGSVPDGFKMLDAIPKDYDPGRQRGALWTLALQWGAAHDWHNSDALLLPFLDAMFRARVPGESTAGAGDLKLKPVKLEDGWLGDRTSIEGNFATIAPWAEYKGNKAAASWLPNRSLAHIWRAFESKDPLVKIEAATADGKLRLPADKKREMVVEAGTMVTLEAVVTANINLKKVQFYSGDSVLGESAQAPWKLDWKPSASGPHAVFVQWESEPGQRGVSNPALIVVKKAAVP